MSIRQFPFMAFAALLYFIIVGLAGLALDRTALTIPMPSGAGLALTIGEILIIVAVVLSFFELIGSSASSSAILSHGLQLIVFLVCLLLLLLLPRFGTGVFLIIVLMTLINTVAGYSISILRARRDFTLERTID